MAPSILNLLLRLWVSLPQVGSLVTAWRRPQKSFGGVGL